MCLVVRSSIPYAAAFRPFGIIEEYEFVFNRLQFESCWFWHFELRYVTERRRLAYESGGDI